MAEAAEKENINCLVSFAADGQKRRGDLYKTAPVYLLRLSSNSINTIYFSSGSQISSKSQRQNKKRERFCKPAAAASTV